MQPLKHILMFILFTSLLTISARAGEPLQKQRLAELEQRLTQIDTELEQLASYSLRSGVGTIGYQSRRHSSPSSDESIQIDLAEQVPVDQVVLVPGIWRDPDTGLRADGFPRAFRVLAGTDTTTNVVASFTEADNLLPRIAPLVVPFAEPIAASWIRIEASVLSSRGLGGNFYALQLAELLIFSGDQNVALHQPVSVSSQQNRIDDARNPQFIVDGFVPYLMDAAAGNNSAANRLTVKPSANDPALTIDLGQTYPVEQLNLHAVDLSRFVPVAAPTGHAMPSRLRVSGANRPDFSDQTMLFEYQQNSAYDAGPIIMRRFPQTDCRYIRLTALELSPNATYLKGKLAIGFAEIEVLSNGQNVALKKPITLSKLAGSNASLRRITDGNNVFGKILSTREWMNQLAHRHNLEAERPLIEAELNRRYTRQKWILKILSWLAALLAAGTIIILLIEQNIRQRAIFRTRERIAANLHDELGANLHAIALLGDTAQKVVNQKNAAAEWSDLTEIVDEIRDLTHETGATARYCSNMLEADAFHQNPLDEMRRISDRLLNDLEHTFTVADPEILNPLQPRRRIDFILFYKECLTNIIRHSGATSASTELTADAKEISLTIHDNGRGAAAVPASLKRRARLLKAHVELDHSADTGTRISLRLRPARKQK